MYLKFIIMIGLLVSLGDLLVIINKSFTNLNRKEMSLKTIIKTAEVEKEIKVPKELIITKASIYNLIDSN